MVSFISFKAQQQAFPLHFHPEYCISRIHKGVEVLQLQEQRCLGKAGDITLTHPYELHSNPIYSSADPLSFDTLYIGVETFRAYSPTRELLHFQQPVFRDSTLWASFETVLSNREEMEATLSDFLMELARVGQPQEEPYLLRVPLTEWSVLDAYVEQHLHRSLSLEELAQVVHLNKFGFARKFKRETGLSPVHYVLMKKVFHCKERIQRHSSISELAYAYDFADVAHFSKTFKRFIGISPTVYRDEMLSRSRKSR